jgi:hypothetical protein
MAELKPVTIRCPVCGAQIGLPARLCLSLNHVDPVADLTLDLDPVRAHAKEHADALPAALAHFGVPY